MNFAASLKAEIVRLARKEVRAETKALKDASTRHRSDIAALKRTVAELQREIRRLAKDRGQVKAPAGQTAVQHRFSEKRFAAHRARLGLSAAKMGKLIGVSGQTVYSWEAGKGRPSKEHLPALAAACKLSPAKALEVLAGLD